MTYLFSWHAPDKSALTIRESLTTAFPGKSLPNFEKVIPKWFPGLAETAGSIIANITEREDWEIHSKEIIEPEKLQQAMYDAIVPFAANISNYLGASQVVVEFGVAFLNDLYDAEPNLGINGRGILWKSVALEIARYMTENGISLPIRSLEQFLWDKRISEHEIWSANPVRAGQAFPILSQIMHELDEIFLEGFPDKQMLKARTLITKPEK